MKRLLCLCRVRVAAAVVTLTLVAVLLLPADASAQCAPEWMQRYPTAAPSPRDEQAMAYDSNRGATVLFGGDDGEGGRLGDTWEWDGTNWRDRTPQPPAASPSPRRQPAMAYDSTRGVAVLFGGWDGTATLADTWTWDGTNWMQLHPATSPPVRHGHAMAYDSARGVTVLFGGCGTSYPCQLADTWEWNGTNWTQRMPAASPSARRNYSMAYDSTRRVTVLFGGHMFDGLAGDTWEWNGTNWIERTPGAGPSGRRDSAMAYDGDRGVTVLFGGWDGTSYLEDTWEWDGTGWTRRILPNPPLPRAGHAMAFDSGRHATVLFGGFDAGNLADTWEYACPCPVRFLQQPVSTAVVEGSDAGFGVTVASSELASVNYQWRKNGVPIVGASGTDKAFFRIAAAKLADAGSYDVVVTAGWCVLTSEPATLTVNWRPDFDNDGDVDLVDFSLFQICFNGPNRPPGPWCP